MVSTRSRRTAGVRQVARKLLMIVVALFVGLVSNTDGYTGSAYLPFVAARAIGNEGFRLASWELSALASKAADLVLRPGSDLSADQQHDLVLAYFYDLGHMDSLDSDIQAIYADRAQLAPEKAAAALMAELTRTRSVQSQRRPAVEAILQQQVSAVIRDQRIASAGFVFPPVSFRFSESPDYLIISPRDQIRIAEGIYLNPGIDVPQIESIETRIEEDLNVSALVEGTGGFSSYPTMIIDYWDMNWVISTIAHEWGHTYLLLHPLGWHYSDSPDTRTLNETTVSILGDEIAELVMERFYPDQLPTASWPRPLAMQPSWWEDNQPKAGFEFGPFMRATRIRVDELLASGDVAGAESYMEERRQQLVQRGYTIRRLNQAYFAFHGSYAMGTGATDPIGGKLRALRHYEGSLAQFMRTVSSITNVSELDAALQRHQ